MMPGAYHGDLAGVTDCNGSRQPQGRALPTG